MQVGTTPQLTRRTRFVTSTSIERLRSRLVPLRNSLLTHPVYAKIDRLAALRLFMEGHIFAVWDFMSLLKALQRQLCCVEVPWTPPANPHACRLVNQIVLGEESDEDELGNPASHFDLYRRAMGECGADTGPIDRFLEEIRQGRTVEAAIEAIGLPDRVRQFVGQTFEVIEGGELCAIASAFTFGREALLPDVFRRIVAELDTAQGTGLGGFRYYLDRHIEVDDGEHGPLAERLVEDLCDDDPDRWRSAEDAAIRSLEARVVLWDEIDARIDAMHDSGQAPQ